MSFQPEIEITLVCLFAWLVFETVWDLRDRNIPIWFSLTMLIPGFIVLAVGVSLWPAILIAISVACTEAYRRAKLIALIGIVVPIGLILALFPALQPLAIFWMVIVALWLAGVIGGADALALLSLSLFFPSNWIMPIAILCGILCWNSALLLLKYRQDAGLRVWTVLRARASGDSVVGIGAYALAVLFYGVYVLAR
jgi:Flp pilus assembly protein protease CpaA